MNRHYRDRWIKGLRSGDFIQGSTYLKQKLNDGSYCHCAMGVAAELFSKELGLKRFESHGVVLFDGISAMLTHNFREELEISTNSLMKIGEMNDKQNKSYADIADWLEANE